MKCRDCEQLISGYLDGELGESEQFRFEEHLASCRECSEIVGDLGALDETLRESSEIIPDEGYWTGFSARLNERIEKAKTQQEPWWRTAFRFTRPLSWIVVAIVVAVGFMSPVIREQVLKGTRTGEHAPMSVPVTETGKLHPGVSDAVTAPEGRSPAQPSGFDDDHMKMDEKSAESSVTASPPSSSENRAAKTAAAAPSESETRGTRSLESPENGFLKTGRNEIGYGVVSGEKETKPTPDGTDRGRSHINRGVTSPAGAGEKPTQLSTERKDTFDKKKTEVERAVAGDKPGSPGTGAHPATGVRSRSAAAEKPEAPSLKASATASPREEMRLKSGTANEGVEDSSRRSVTPEEPKISAKPDPEPARDNTAGAARASRVPPMPAPPPAVLSSPLDKFETSGVPSFSREYPSRDSLSGESLTPRFSETAKRIPSEGKTYLARSEVLLVKIVNFSDGNSELEQLRSEIARSNFLADLEKGLKKFSDDPCLDNHLRDVRNVASKLMTVDADGIEDLKQQVIDTGLLEKTRVMKY